ncbi:MAG: 4Fe-4S dicluster domain-containing protein [Chloroflexi bacterium]|nr:4Fe-4S dicluster domain-containing protein [Chloroflexota bacterium]
MAIEKRKMIRIREDQCDGCGLCIPACPEGALQIIDGKARLVKESFCDGLGACLGDCPQGALLIEEQAVESYDEDGVIAHLRAHAPEALDRHIQHLRAHAAELPLRPTASPAGCPGASAQQWENPRASAPSARLESALRQWPIQLHLVAPGAPYFQNAELVLVADCVPFAYSNFHADFLDGHAIAIACPKLDDTRSYASKLAQIIAHDNIKSITVVRMEVPCCSGLVRLAQQALTASGKTIPLEETVIGIHGHVLK